MTKTTYQKVKPVQKLIVVNSRLRHGDLSKVARIAGVSPTTVKSVIEGNSENFKVLNAAYDVTRSRKKNFQVIKDMKTRINKLQEA